MGGGAELPVRNHTSWDVPAELAELRPFGGSSQLLGSYPAFQVICTNCGLTVLVNAVVAGLSL